MDTVNSNVIDFSKFIPQAKDGIDREAAKNFFISQVLPYASGASLERLITASIAGDQQKIQVEMMRMYIESELAKPEATETNTLLSFFR